MRDFFSRVASSPRNKIPVPRSTLPRRFQGESVVIAIASGKGGVGKTWLSITLAEALVAEGSNVFLFDGDLGLANINVQLGLTPSFDIVDVVNGRQSIDRATTGLHDGALHVLSGRSGSAALGRLDGRDFTNLCSSLVAHRARYDHLILDLAAGVGTQVLEMSNLADILLVVVTEEPTSLTDAYAFIKSACRLPRPPEMRIVVNMAARPERYCDAYQTLLTTCRKFLNLEPALAGVIPRDGRVVESIRRQRTLAARYTETPALCSVRRLAESLVQKKNSLRVS